jgi:hypothetical protein
MNACTARITLLACALAFSATAFAQPRTTTMEEDKSGIWSKVANHRAQANAAKSRGNFDDDGERCGNVDIGNVDTGGSGRGAPRQVVTVITGDVINAPARCK